MNQYYTIESMQVLNSSWQPSASTNDNLRVDAGITSNWKYRTYMQNCGKDIMKTNSMLYFNASGNNPYIVHHNNPVNNTPYLFDSNHQSVYEPNSSDLKMEYLTKINRQSRMVAPSIPTNRFQLF